MKPEFEVILVDVKHRSSLEITETNNDPHIWYELFVSEGEAEGTHTVESGDTFEQAVAEFQKYAELYGLDNIFLDAWINKISPKQTEHSFWNANLFYEILCGYFAKSGELSTMKMIGDVAYPEDGDRPKFTKHYRGKGQYFADEIAFRYFRDRVCYIPEHGDEDDPASHYTRARLIEVCGGNEKRAAQLFTHFSWECPETLLEQWEATDGMFDEDENLSKETTLNEFTYMGHKFRGLRQFTPKENFGYVTKCLTDIWRSRKDGGDTEWNWNEFIECAKTVGYGEMDVFIMDGNREVVPCENFLGEYEQNK